MTSTDERPFRVLGLQQVAIGALDKAELEAFWVTLLGLSVEGHFESSSENVSETLTSLGTGSARVEIDLMQPLDPTRAPKVHEPSLNHIGLWVDDLAQAKDWLESHGVRFAPGGIRKGASGYDVCFIHPKGNDAFPKSGMGVLIELVQAPPEVIADLKR